MLYTLPKQQPELKINTTLLLETKGVTSLEKRHWVFASKEPIQIRVTVWK